MVVKPLKPLKPLKPWMLFLLAFFLFCLGSYLLGAWLLDYMGFCENCTGYADPHEALNVGGGLFVWGLISFVVGIILRKIK